MSDVSLPTNGYVVVATPNRVIAASGFGMQGIEPDVPYRGKAVVAYDAGSGDVIWEQTISDPDLDGAVFVVEATADVVVVSNSAGELIGMDASNGTQIWQTTLPNGFTTSRGVVSGARRLIVGASGHGGDVGGPPPMLLNLDMATGERIWSSELTANTELQPSPPLVLSGVVYVQAVDELNGDNILIGVDVETGKTLGEMSLGGTPAFHLFRLEANSTQIFVPVGGSVVALDRSGLSIAWRLEAARIYGIADDGSLILAAGGKIVLADPRTGKTVRTIVREESLVSDAAVIGDYLWFTDDRGLRIVSLKEDEQIPETVLEASPTDRMSLGSGFVAVSTGEPSVAVFDIP